MPYASEAQRRYLHAQKPEVAARFDAEERRARSKRALTSAAIWATPASIAGGYFGGKKGAAVSGAAAAVSGGVSELVRKPKLPERVAPKKPKVVRGETVTMDGVEKRWTPKKIADYERLARRSPASSPEGFLYRRLEAKRYGEEAGKLKKPGQELRPNAIPMGRKRGPRTFTDAEFRAHLGRGARKTSKQALTTIERGTKWGRPFAKRDTKQDAEAAGMAAGGVGLLAAGTNAQKLADKGVRSAESGKAMASAAADARIARLKLADPKPNRLSGSTQERRRANKRAAKQARTKKIKRVEGWRNLGNRTGNAAIRGINAGRIPLAASAFLGGGALTWQGARRLAEPDVSKALTRSDVDAAAVGGAAGAGGYQLGMYGTKGVDRYYNRKLAQDETVGNQGGRLRQVEAEHRKKVGLPKNAPAGDQRYLKYYRTYPKELPGWRWRRAMSHLHAGKGQVAITTGVGGAAAVGALGLKRQRDNVAKRYRVGGTNVREYKYLPENIRELSRDRSFFRNPISPLDMYASSRQIARFLGPSPVGSRMNLPRNLNRRTEGINQFNASRMMIFSPLGRGSVQGM